MNEFKRSPICVDKRRDANVATEDLTPNCPDPNKKAHSCSTDPKDVVTRDVTPNCPDPNKKALSCSTDPKDVVTGDVTPNSPDPNKKELSCSTDANDVVTGDVTPNCPDTNKKALSCSTDPKDLVTEDITPNGTGTKKKELGCSTDTKDVVTEYVAPNCPDPKKRTKKDKNPKRLKRKESVKGSISCGILRHVQVPSDAILGNITISNSYRSNILEAVGFMLIKIPTSGRIIVGVKDIRVFQKPMESEEYNRELFEMIDDLDLNEPRNIEPIYTQYAPLSMLVLEDIARVYKSTLLLKEYFVVVPEGYSQISGGEVEEIKKAMENDKYRWRKETTKESRGEDGFRSHLPIVHANYFVFDKIQ
jgi:hypothetical protein